MTDCPVTDYILNDIKLKKAIKRKNIAVEQHLRKPTYKTMCKKEQAINEMNRVIRDIESYFV